METGDRRRQAGYCNCHWHGRLVLAARPAARLPPPDFFSILRRYHWTSATVGVLPPSPPFCFSQSQPSGNWVSICSLRAFTLRSLRPGGAIVQEHPVQRVSVSGARSCTGPVAKFDMPIVSGRRAGSGNYSRKWRESLIASEGLRGRRDVEGAFHTRTLVKRSAE